MIQSLRKQLAVGDVWLFCNLPFHWLLANDWSRRFYSVSCCSDHSPCRAGTDTQARACAQTVPGDSGFLAGRTKAFREVGVQAPICLVAAPGSSPDDSSSLGFSLRFHAHGRKFFKSLVLLYLFFSWVYFSERRGVLHVTENYQIWKIWPGISLCSVSGRLQGSSQASPSVASRWSPWKDTSSLKHVTFQEYSCVRPQF